VLSTPSGPGRRRAERADLIEHDQTPNDPVVHQLVLEALSHSSGPADPRYQPTC
jgi:hypothetical protein